MVSSETASTTEARLRVIQIIWAAFLGSVFVYAVVGYVVHPPKFSVRSLGYVGESNSVALALTASLMYTVGLLAAVLFAPMILRKFLRRAELEQKPELVQTGFIIAFAVSEAGALMGLVILFLTGSWNAFLLMGISAMMIGLIRPRPEQLAAANYKSS